MSAQLSTEAEPDDGTSAQWLGAWPQTVEEFEALVDMFQDRLVRYCFRRLGDLQEAEDAAQEVFVKAYTGRGQLRHVTHVAPYLYRMAANHCLDCLRRPRPVMVCLDDMQSDHPAEPGRSARDRAVAAEELRRANELLSHLPEPQAEVLRLRVLDGLSLAEIAQMQSASVPTVKSRLSYAVGKLRRLLSARKDKLQ